MKRHGALVVGIAGLLAMAAPSADAGKVLRMGTLAPEGSRYMEDIEGFSRDIERLSDGELRLKWYSGGALGEDKTMCKMVEDGKLDGGGFTDAGLGWIVPEMRVWGFPAMFEGYDEVDFAEKEFFEKFQKLYEDRGLILLVFADVGFLHVFSDRAITSYKDLKSSTLWTWQDEPATIEAVKLLGIEVVHSSLADLRDDLEADKIDTWQYPPLAVVGFGLHPFAKYMSELRFRYMIGAIVIRKAAWDELPEDQQRLVRDVAEKWEKEFTIGLRRDNDKAIEAMKKQGLKVSKISNAEREAFYQAASKQQSAIAKKWKTEELMEEFSEAVQKFRELRKRR